MIRAEYIEVEPNVSLHVKDYGEGQPIVLIHGWPLSNDMYEYQYNELAQNRCRVIGISLRGYGKSSKPYGDYSYDRHCRDIKHILEVLEINDAVLGGFSMGGAIAANFVVKYNATHVAKLALFGAALPIWTQRDDFPYSHPREDADNFIELNSLNRPKLLEEFGKIFARGENALPTEIDKWFFNIGMEASSYATKEGLVKLRDTDSRSIMSKISIPTTIFHGKYDKVCPFDLAEQMINSIQNATLIPFENSGHALFYEEMDKFNRELLKFAKSEVLEYTT